MWLLLTTILPESKYWWNMYILIFFVWKFIRLTQKAVLKFDFWPITNILSSIWFLFCIANKHEIYDWIFFSLSPFFASLEKWVNRNFVGTLFSRNENTFCRIGQHFHSNCTYGIEISTIQFDHRIMTEVDQFQCSSKLEFDFWFEQLAN